MIRCICEGRGWVVELGSEWWTFCPWCQGKTHVSVARAAKLFGVSAGVIKRLMKNLPIRTKSAEKILRSL